jgi:hypothetical protein
MTSKSEEDFSERLTLTHKSYANVWASLQGSLHPYVKALKPLVERSLVDSRFRAKMLQSPDAVFKEAGVVFEDGVRVEVVEETQETRYLVLPPPVESVPRRRMDLFNRMLTSGRLPGTWGTDDSDTEDSKVMTGDPDADHADPTDDDWHPF